MVAAMAAAGADLTTVDPTALSDDEKTEYMQRMQMKMNEQMAQMVQQQQMAVQQQQATEAALANALAAKNAFFFAQSARRWPRRGGPVCGHRRWAARDPKRAPGPRPAGIRAAASKLRPALGGRPRRRRLRTDFPAEDGRRLHS